MKRIRKTLPSTESQNPSTCHFLLPSVVSKFPSRVASVKGFAARGGSTLAVISRMSYASTTGADCEKETPAGGIVWQEIRNRRVEIGRRIQARLVGEKTSGKDTGNHSPHEGRRPIRISVRA